MTKKKETITPIDFKGLLKFSVSFVLILLFVGYVFINLDIEGIADVFTRKTVKPTNFFALSPQYQFDVLWACQLFFNDKIGHIGDWRSLINGITQFMQKHYLDRERSAQPSLLDLPRAEALAWVDEWDRQVVICWKQQVSNNELPAECFWLWPVALQLLKKYTDEQEVLRFKAKHHWVQTYESWKYLIDQLNDESSEQEMESHS